MRVGLIGAGRIGVLHAETLAGFPEVDSLIVADADPARARAVAGRLDTGTAGTAAGIIDGHVAGAFGGAAGARVDGVVIAAATPAHAGLIHAAARAGLPVFCEKPMAPDVAGTRDVLDHVAAAGVPLQVGFQRRFDAGYRAAREAVRDGELGWLHTLRAVTADPEPPHPSYIPVSGGIFRDCGVHDYDAIRWVTGREVVEVYASGANRGETFFAAAGDSDTAATVLTLDDGTLATCTTTRYNGAGYDVRLEVCGSRGTIVAGLDEHAPLLSVGGAPPSTAPTPYLGFLERFRSAYVAELHAFTEVVAGSRESPCTGEEALQALLVAEAAELSRCERRPVRVEEVR